MPAGAVLRRGAHGGERSEIGQHSQISEIQRSRLLAAAIAAVDELGYADTTVSDVTNRARVSRRTFYELFSNREECLAAVLEDVVALIGAEVSRAGLEGLAWRERVRRGLWAILSFLDREPALARVCVVQALRGGPEVLERRDQILAGLAAVVDDGRLEGARGEQCTPLTAEGVVGAAFAIVYARLLRREQGPLTGLLGELMGMIVLPYLGGAAARREQARPAPAEPVRVSAESSVSARVADDPLRGVSMRLTYRTARVLEGVAELPGGSNREIGERAGIQDPGQVSKLLSRLRSLGLLANGCEGHAKGEPNAWTLTLKGERVIQGIRMHTAGDRQAV
jgi:AcrR family transcriptional regulator